MFNTKENAEDPAQDEPGDGLPLTSWLVDKADAESLREMLRDVIDPEVGINIVDLGLVYDVRLASDGVAAVRMTMTTPGCPLGGYFEDEVHNCLWGAPGVDQVDLQIVWEPPWDPDEMMSDWAKEQLGWRR
jgi:metal-sulfur cluster biosynthetic enzyme